MLANIGRPTRRPPFFQFLDRVNRVARSTMDLPQIPHQELTMDRNDELFQRAQISIPGGVNLPRACFPLGRWFSALYRSC